jgi:beta-mannanase
MVALVAGIVALVALQLQGLGSGTGPSASAEPWPITPPKSARVDLGVTTIPLARNAWRTWSPSDLVSVNTWEQAIRQHAGIVMWYEDWTGSPPSFRQLDAIAARGSVPEITWEPWRSFPSAEERIKHPGAPVKVQPRFRLRNIVSGRFDPYVRSWARRFAAYGRPVRLRFAHEMNGGWYPWSERANGNRPGEFVQAWRHVRRIFRRAGATNVRWVWSPAAIQIVPGQYPGDAYVDIVGLTVFNGGLQLRYNPWRSFASAVETPLAQLNAITTRKPIEISEVGCSEQGGDKAAWIADMFATMRSHPEIRSLIWYDLLKGSDWRVTSSAEATAAFAEGAADPRYR